MLYWPTITDKVHGSSTLLEQEIARENSKSKEYKEVQLVDGSPEKTALIGANLDTK